MKYVIIATAIAAHNLVLRPSDPRRTIDHGEQTEAGSYSFKPSTGRQSDVSRIVCVIYQI